MANYKNKKLKKIKEIAIISASSLAIFLLFAFLTIYFAIGHYFFAVALDSSFTLKALAPKDMQVEMDQPIQKNAWLENIDKNVVQISSYDGYKLTAYEIFNMNSDRFAILVHGYRGDAMSMSFYAYKYFGEGYNVLLLNLKGHAQSEGRYIGMGLGDSKDVVLWVQYLASKHPNCKIVLHGVSMGASTVMMATGENLPQNVKVAVADCGFSNAYEQFKYVAKDVLHLPFSGLIMHSANTFSLFHTKTALKDIDVISRLQKSTTPTLFIHGDADDFVPFYMLDKVYEAHTDPQKEKLIVHGATHAYSASKDPELYFSTTFEFIDRYLEN